ncbi:MAG: DUF547 domain-containing protein [Myxococcales bacterium]|nr:DUF547 domain-containing protein [Myxococcales bacterium]
MKRWLAVFFVSLVPFSAALAQQNEQNALDAIKAQTQANGINHAPFDALLKANVDAKAGRVNYAGFVGNADFTAYLATIAATDPASLPSDQARLAFWINAYNALTISGVLKNWPGITSVSTVYPDFAFFKRKDYTVGGKQYALNDIENEVIRPTFKDPRVHAALNCASVSCPPLAAHAFSADKIDAQLTEVMTAFANDTMRNPIKPGAVQLSQIFNWYKDDFASAGGPAKFLAPMITDAARRDALLQAGSIGFVDYDWNLNKTP